MRETKQEPDEVAADAMMQREQAEDEAKLFGAIEAIGDVLGKAKESAFGLASSTARLVANHLRDLADHVDDYWPEEEV